MEKQFCTYEISLKLKELGFDEPCLGCFGITYGILAVTKMLGQDKDNKLGLILAPLWQQVIDWFRTKYKIHILVVPEFACWQMRISKYDEFEDDNIALDIECLDFKDFTDYNKCRAEAILKAIELIKEK